MSLRGQAGFQGCHDVSGRGAFLRLLAGADGEELDHALVGRVQLLHVQGRPRPQRRVVRLLVEIVFVKGLVWKKRGTPWAPAALRARFSPRSLRVFDVKAGPVSFLPAGQKPRSWFWLLCRSRLGCLAQIPAPKFQQEVTARLPGPFSASF